MRNGKGQFVKGSSGFTGKHTEKTKSKIRKARARQGSNVWNKGKSGYKVAPCSDERKRNIGKAQKGKLNHNWKGGITPLRTQIWHTFEYRQWRSDIFTRDDFRCVLCDFKGGHVEVDHYPKAFSTILKEYNIKTLEDALICEELWNINNGRTLCKNCHLKTDNYGGRIKKIK